MISIALSARWHAFPERFYWIAEHRFNLEYTPGSDALDKLPGHVDLFVRKGLNVRYHAFFPGYELGDPDPALAERAFYLHKQTLEAMGGHGEQVITVHVGLDPNIKILPQRAVDNLKRLVECGLRQGVTVCLENLRRGPSSRPDTLIAWASESGTRVTFDAGHAISCHSVKSGEYTALEFLDLVADRVSEAHLYGREEERHYPIQSAEAFQSIVDRLLETNCNWWTIELEDYNEALKTRQILRECLKKQRAKVRDSSHTTTP